MTDQEHESLLNPVETIEPEQRERRNFLLSLGKWSKAVIGGVVLGGLLTPGRNANAIGWGNRNNGDKTWVNLGGGGFGWRPGWYNRGGWYNGGWNNRGWHNRPWYNRGGWYNGGWNNGGSWYNGYGPGNSWINR
ncbi:MAG: hypothetical protein QG599_3684 [Pseudomonadota bacterium]|nr:hypothetical protein [Pseudomonadota bacterium]